VQLWNVSRLIICCLIVSKMELATAASPRTGCEIPPGLREQLSKKYGTAQIVTVPALELDDREFYTKDHGDECPGLVALDFYGDHKPTLALVLKKDSDFKETELIVAHLIGGTWRLLLLETAHDGVPVVWTERPGKYTDVYRHKELQAKNPVIVLSRYESWSILYAWTGKQVQKIWLQD